MPEVKEDYSVDSQFQHIDIRFSNLCNFKCRMCNHDFSSNWYEDSQKIHNYTDKGRTKVMKVSDTIVEDLIPHLKNIKSFYFAGGEPLIIPEHYKVLKHLYDTMPVIEQHWGNVRPLSIHYNTNLSVITYDENSLVELWKGFDRVFLSISCDGIGEVGEYQRIGFLHDKFITNLKTIQKYFTPKSPYDGGFGLQYNFQYTTTIWNAYHIFDFIKFMKENDFIKTSEHIDFYYAWSPSYASLNNLPDYEKVRLVEFLENGIKDLTEQKTIDELRDLIKFINSTNNVEKAVEGLFHFTTEMDKMNNTDVNKLNGVDFKQIELQIISEIIGNTK
jgi:MoaA/NifB/PqqE/SkfB family radical SAM enzyme